MSENLNESSCAQCGRNFTDQHNFCPYCGHDMRDQEPTAVTPAPRPQATSPPPSSVKKITPARPKIPATRPSSRRFQVINLRAILGLFDLIAIPIIAILAVLLIRSGIALPEPIPPLACDEVSAAEFVPARFERGLGGEIDEDTLFAANTEYLVQSVLVIPQNRRLLVEPGVHLEFEDGAGIDVQGAFYVCGTENEPVTFTSEAGEPGSWQGIRFLDANDTSVLAHALVQFAGDRAIYLENSAPILLGVKIASSSGFPISSDGNEMPQLLANVEFDKNPFDGIEIRGGQTADKQVITWSNQGFVYVVSGPLEIGENTTLTIEPGTNIKFWYSGNGNPPGLKVRGLLKAEDVNFTSVYDGRDEVGGVTYVEAQDPQPGDWAGIALNNSSSQSYLRQVLVQYAGNGQGAISMQASSPELTNVAIRDSAWYPLSGDADSFPSLTQITLADNEPGDAMEIRGGSAITGRQSYTWSLLGNETQIVRVIRGTVTVQQEATLTIEPGVVIKFEEDSKLVIQGTLEAIGGEKDDGQIVFTSLRDDEYGGVTDKNTGPQDSRSWDGIIFDKSDENAVLENAIVRYGPVAFNDSGSQLRAVTIRDSETAAIWLTPNAAPTLQNLQLQGNAIDGIAIAGGKMEVDQIWPLLEGNGGQVVRVLMGNVIVSENAVLQIQSGVIIKANKDGKLTVNGDLRVAGDAGRPVIFTSLHDDSSGGDTNQKLQDAAAGDWPGLEAAASADISFASAEIRYANTGLALRGGAAPEIVGELRITAGKTALWCDGRAEMPATLIAEGNEDNYRQCPTQ